MKYKALVIGLVCAVIACSVLLSSIATGDKNHRVHQHKEARQPEAGCNCSGDTLCTHLPLVVIDTNGEEIPGVPVLDEATQSTTYTTTADGEAMLSASIKVIDNQDSNNHPEDEAALTTASLIRVRGNSSRYFDKKSYLLRFTRSDGSYANHEVMGMDAHYEWALYGPYLDKSLIRNYMWYNIAGEIMDYAPNVRFCEVILNGTYQGLYVMTETLTSGENCRLNLTEPLEGATATGYLVRLDRGSTQPVKNIETFTQQTYRNFQVMDIKYPRIGKLTPARVRAIEQELSDFEKALYSYDYDTENYGYWHYIDANSFVDYFIINEFTANYDAGWLSTYMYKDVGGKYKMVIWDFNSACENYTHVVSEPQHTELQNNIWYYMLTKDEYFNQKILHRYRELRKSFLNEEYLNQYIDETTAYLGGAIDRNFTVWGYSLAMDMIQPVERNPRSQQEAAEQMKQFIDARGTWMDQHLETIRQYSHESKVKKFNH